MAQQNQGGGGDTFEMVLYWLIGIAFIACLVSAVIYFEAFFMGGWKFIRTVELVLSLRFDLIAELYQNNIRWGDVHFENINQGFYTPMRIVMVGIVWLAVAKALKRQRLYYSDKRTQVEMNEVLGVYFKRFPWLSILGGLKGTNFLFTPDSLSFKNKDIVMEFEDKDFIKGLNPYEYLVDFAKRKNKDINDDTLEIDLEKELRPQLGPKLYMKGGRVFWQDKVAEKLANQIIQMIPESRAPGSSKTEREKAIDLAGKVSCFERTYVMVLFSCAKCYGVAAPMNFLWLRDEATKRARAKKSKTPLPKSAQYEDPFVLWRMILARARGGILGTVRSAYPEAVALCSQYNFEVKCYRYIEEHKNNLQDVETLKKINAVLEMIGRPTISLKEADKQAVKQAVKQDTKINPDGSINGQATVVKKKSNRVLGRDEKQIEVRLAEACAGFIEVRDKREKLIKN